MEREGSERRRDTSTGTCYHGDRHRSVINLQHLKGEFTLQFVFMLVVVKVSYNHLLQLRTFDEIIAWKL